MNIYYRLLLILFLHININTSAQVDTIRFMQYNLLTYGNSSNPANYKNPRLKTVVQFIQPDIISANEISDNPTLSENILINVLGQDWEKGAYSNSTNDFQTNMLFWKKNKFVLINQQVIGSVVRDIIAYKLYYNDNNPGVKDTIFLTVIVAHLKAGSEVQDEAKRALEAQVISNYLNSMGQEGNLFLMGDLNTYSSNDEGYKKLVQSPGNASRLYDPLNMPGDWHDNIAFAGIHTQSTRTSGLGDGGATGGVDDRFDFILTSHYTLNSTQGIQYVAGSYKAAGQDGNHFNNSINAAPINTSAPSDVIQALYELSDHLPVYADFVFDPSQFLSIPRVEHTLAKNISVTNPVASNNLDLFFSPELIGTQLTIELYNLPGDNILKERLLVTGNYHSITLPASTPGGTYILYIRDGFNSMTKRLVKM